MAITKTDFINYTRCARYVALEEVRHERLNADITYQEYKTQEKEENTKELLSNMFGDDDYTKDLTQKENKQLEVMLPYYKRVEIEAGKIAQKYFGGKSIYAEETFNQKSFSFSENAIKYICYVDIFNEVEKDINIIEVKATTSNKFLKLESGYKEKGKYSIFSFDALKNCYYLKDEIKGYNIEIEMPLKNYEQKRSQLFDRYSETGTYVYDLAIQRYFLEMEYKELKQEEKLKNIHYYLAILNHAYTFDGTYEGKNPLYHPDKNNQELVVFIDLTKITEEYQPKIKEIKKKLEKDLLALDANPCKLGSWCDKKGYKECPYFELICGKKIPKYNSSLNYLNNTAGFKDENGKRLKGLDLINEGYYKMLDIPDTWITNKKHQIQRESVAHNKVYIDKEKIKAGLSCLEYPIYHLDFETMPCPLPRFKGEKPYMQSPFEFSLHIEESPGKCDEIKDNYVFLAKSIDTDEREDLIRKLIELIDSEKGTLFAQNVAFEKTRIKELANIFPEYKEKLMKIYNRGFDLIWLVNTKSDLYESLGFDKERSSLPNYYSKELSGSYSIKKTLPVFSDLSYNDLIVKNGTEAIVAYAMYNKMSKEEFNLYYDALRTYCRQDTWAMVVILNALRKMCQENVKELTFSCIE